MWGCGQGGDMGMLKGGSERSKGMGKKQHWGGPWGLLCLVGTCWCHIHQCCSSGRGWREECGQDGAPWSGGHCWAPWGCQKGWRGEGGTLAFPVLEWKCICASSTHRSALVPCKGWGAQCTPSWGAQGWQQALTWCTVCRQSTQDDLQPVLAQLLVDYSLQSSLSV